ncbi:hypothetical protein ASH01_11505 [Terrabacter sp. Soil811]|nr:hypothetical protein ASH01_11505 [Terrabacter sp. Soil811]
MSVGERRCLSIGAYQGATILSRAILEVTCKHKGASAGALAARIDTLKDADYVRPHLAAVAHEVP